MSERRVGGRVRTPSAPRLLPYLVIVVSGLGWLVTSAFMALDRHVGWAVFGLSIVLLFAMAFAVGLVMTRG